MLGIHIESATEHICLWTSQYGRLLADNLFCAWCSMLGLSDAWCMLHSSWLMAENSCLSLRPGRAPSQVRVWGWRLLKSCGRIWGWGWYQVGLVFDIFVLIIRNRGAMSSPPLQITMVWNDHSWLESTGPPIQFAGPPIRMQGWEPLWKLQGNLL